MNIVSKDVNGYDDSVVKEVPRHYATIVPDMKNKVVLDIGGHIGAFALLAVESGAAKVISVEPGTVQHTHYQKNAEQEISEGKVICYHAAVVGAPIKNVTLRFNANGACSSANRIVTDTKRTKGKYGDYGFESVRTILFSRLLHKYAPAVVKMDCEGAEYACLLNLKEMPECVRVLIAEFHNTSGAEGINNYIACVKKLRAWGFKADKMPNLKAKRNSAGEIIGGNQFFIRPIAWRR